MFSAFSGGQIVAYIKPLDVFFALVVAYEYHRQSEHGEE
jgi:hypothetical protein